MRLLNEVLKDEILPIVLEEEKGMVGPKKMAVLKSHLSTPNIIFKSLGCALLHLVCLCVPSSAFMGLGAVQSFPEVVAQA